MFCANPTDWTANVRWRPHNSIWAYTRNWTPIGPWLTPTNRLHAKYSSIISVGEIVSPLIGAQSTAQQSSECSLRTISPKHPQFHPTAPALASTSSYKDNRKVDTKVVRIRLHRMYHVSTWNVVKRVCESSGTGVRVCVNRFVCSCKMLFGQKRTCATDRNGMRSRTWAHGMVKFIRKCV